MWCYMCKEGLHGCKASNHGNNNIVEGVTWAVQRLLCYLEAQIVRFVHQELNLLSTLQDTLYVVYHDVLDLVHL